MTAITRTAYPRLGAKLTREELDARYTLNESDLAFVHATARSATGRLLLAVLLKVRQDLGLFLAPTEPHAGTVAHLALQLGTTPPSAPDWVRRTKSLYRSKPLCGPTCPWRPTTMRPRAWSRMPCSPPPRR